MSFARLGCCLAIGAVAVVFAHSEGRAQSPTTCSFDPTTAIVTVNVNAQAATVSRTASGVIRLNGAGCGGATTTNTDRIRILGGPLRDIVALSGSFAPGLTPEAGFSEIEVQLSSIQVFTWMLGPDNDNLVFTGTGLDLGADGDVDITGAIIGSIQGGPGDDLLDFSQHNGNFTLDGQTGNDHLIGGVGANYLIGGVGDDTLQGNAGNDRLEGGAGNDIEFGGNGLDTFLEGPTASGGDDIFGGAQRDTVDYGRRTVGVVVTPGTGEDDDGEPGEGDEVAVDVEGSIGGSGDDTLVGTAGQNTLIGGAGNDELFGLANRDLLFGGLGNDFLEGGTGPNDLHGEDGDDILIGDASAIDHFFGGDGNDDITGNTDGRREPVDCGPGDDEVEDNDEDNFIACEL